MNFVRVDEALYFHGSLEGEKAASIRREPRVTFMVDDDFSLIPSTFTNPELACPATQYYKAAVMHGRARYDEEPGAKAVALQALMEKMQPEGGYRPIAADDPVYRKSFESVGVIRLEIERLTAKFKFGQSLPYRKRANVAAQLVERDAGRDVESVEAIRDVCPFE
jgi:nitroimidazol reductase NimA-like FMN-containing flavoprotein (pyridoxamine 5'-phosphate oxidase superfamily)